MCIRDSALSLFSISVSPVSYTHLRAHETREDLVCRLLLEKKNTYTLFVSKISKLDARKKWIISSISPKGKLVIDEGAINALRKGKSLLAAGIKIVEGKFNKGDHVKISDENKNEFARGLSSFTSDEISKIKGQHSNRISEILGYVTKSEVVHKDDMVII